MPHQPAPPPSTIEMGGLAPSAGFPTSRVFFNVSMSPFRTRLSSNRYLAGYSTNARLSPALRFCRQSDDRNRVYDLPTLRGHLLP